MNNIQVRILNPEAIKDAEKMMVAMARLTQRGHKINDMFDFNQMYNKEYSEATLENLCELPHPTIQKFAVINIAIVGASRRFLAQITRHQNEVKFMSGSLQYSDFSDYDNFVVPYDILEKDFNEWNDTGYSSIIDSYRNSCAASMQAYKQAIADGVDNDSAGYLAPQSLRNVLIISATPYQWKHMIRQRTCRRNTPETMYVMLKCWHLLSQYSVMFREAGAPCITGKCTEGKMSCGNPIKQDKPEEILEATFPVLYF